MTSHPALTLALADARRAELRADARARRGAERRPAFGRWLRARRAAADAVEAGGCAEPAPAGC